MVHVSETERRDATTDMEATVVEGGSTIVADQPRRGAVLGRYVVVETLGVGGMGRVLRAYDAKLKREVALKLLRFSGDDSARERLMAEAQSMARLSHPNVLPVFDFDFDEGRPFIAMEYVEGTTVRQWLDDEAPSRAEIMRVFLAAGDGLAAAHAAGLVHCDFKPANVLRGADGRIRVMDFGLASVVLHESSGDASGERASESMRGMVMGTPSYMAPEQHRGEPLDARSDQYAFAVSLWEALHGQRPFAGSTIEEVATAKVQMTLDTSEARPSVPRGLRRVLLRALAPEPGDRFESMEAMLALLRRDPRRRRRVIATMGVLLVSVGGLGAWSSHREDVRVAECLERGGEIRAVWGPEASGAVEQSFGAAQPAYAEDAFARMTPWLDRYTDQWATQRADVCLQRGSGGPLDRLRPAALSCLDERRAELEALVELLHEADVEVVAMAVPSAASLSPLEPCGDPTILGSIPAEAGDASTSDAASALRRALAEVTMLGQAGRYEAAEARVEPVLRQAEALAYEPLVAKALLVAARVARLRGRYEDSRRQAERAFDLAARSGLDDTTASAAIELTDLVGVNLAEHDVGLMWARFGATVIERRSWEDRPVHGHLLGSKGRILSDQAEHEAAAAAYEQALRIVRSTLGDQHPRVADSLSDLGNDAERSGDLDAAIEYHQQALALRESTLGAEHPKVAESLNNLGNAHWGRGDLEIAEARLQRAAKIKAEAFGPDHVRVSTTLQNLGNVLYSQGRVQEAIPYWERSLKIRDAGLPEAHPDRASILANLAAGYLLVGSLDEALDHARRAIDVSTQVHGSEHISLAPQWRILGAVHQQRGERDEAVRAIRRELAIVIAKHGESHLRVAAARRELGKMLRWSGDREAALVEGERAAEIMQQVEASASDRASVDALLFDLLDLDDPASRPRAMQLARSAHPVLCDEDPPGYEGCEQLEAFLTEAPSD